MYSSNLLKLKYVNINEYIFIFYIYSYMKTYMSIYIELNHEH